MVRRCNQRWSGLQRPLPSFRQFRWLSLCLLLWLAADTAFAEAYIKLQLDSSEVFFGDTVVLDVESTGLLDPIDLSLIENQAELLRETTGTRIAVIGGKVVEIAIRRMDLIPKKSGVMVIGPLTAGDVVSNSVHLNILDAVRPDWQPQRDDLQVNVSITPSNTRVNQKAMLKIALLHRYPISNESFTLPDLNGFSKRILVENRRTFIGDNREWFKTEWQYLIFPKQSGSIEIGAVLWSGTVAKSRVERADFKRQSESIILPVQSAPKNTATWWLPAQSIQLTESWSQPPTELRAGDELNRIIKVEASGVLSGQIPSPPVPESRAVKQTLIDTSRQEQLTTDNIKSVAEFTYRVKAQSPIPVFLDTVRLPWWNTRTNEAKEAIIPARRINVGLPDRADVLSKLALQETGVNRIKHWLQSTSWFRLAALIIGSVSGIILLWIVLPQLITRLRRKYKMHRHLSELKSLAERGDYSALYRTLNTPKSRKLMAGSDKHVRHTLESLLFCDQPDQTLPAHDESAHHKVRGQLNVAIQQTKTRKNPVRGTKTPALVRL